MTHHASASVGNSRSRQRTASNNIYSSCGKGKKDKKKKPKKKKKGKKNKKAKKNKKKKAKK